MGNQINTINLSLLQLSSNTQLLHLRIPSISFKNKNIKVKQTNLRKNSNKVCIDSSKSPQSNVISLNSKSNTNSLFLLPHSPASSRHNSISNFEYKSGVSQKDDIQNAENTHECRNINYPINSFIRKKSKVSPAESQYYNLMTIYTFYIKDITCNDIIMTDYFNLDKSWKCILNNELYLFKVLKANHEIENTDCLSWIYDTFYNNLYNYNPQLNEIFHNNLKLQSKAFINILQRSIVFAKQAAIGKKIDFYEIYITHKKININISNYFEISYILLETLHECFGILLFEELETSWKKILSLIISHMIKEEIKYNKEHHLFSHLHF